MADKGFDIGYDMLVRDVGLNIPPFAKRDTQMSCKNVVKTRQIASCRIHVERCIRRIKQYHIVSSVIPLSLVSVADQIWGVCAALSLFHVPLVSDV